MNRLTGWFSGAVLGLLLVASAGAGAAQKAEPAKPHRIHLILKDGSYQIAVSYQITGKLVRYISAERGGAQEEIPIDLVDLEATHRWEKAHAPAAEGDANGGRAPAIDPELLKEEEERTALTPFVEPDLRLPLEDSMLALDEFQGQPELVPLVQTDGDLNHTTSHNVMKRALNPKAASHQMVTIKGSKSYVQLHVDTPVFYLRIGEAASTGSAPLVVDTHGASSASRDGDDHSAESEYVIVRTDVRVDARLIASFNPAGLAEGRAPEGVIATKSETLRGGHWLKLTPNSPLDFGEYALLEVLSSKEINLAVWDFGVHPAAPENRDGIKPEPKKRLDLERRRKQE